MFSNMLKMLKAPLPGNPQQYSHTAWNNFTPGAAGVGLVRNWPLPIMGLGGTRVQKQFYAYQPGIQVFQSYAPAQTNLLMGTVPQAQFLAGQGLSVANYDGTYSAAPDFLNS
jgi:hypothetical protein